jgi:hypothetical protein
MVFSRKMKDGTFRYTECCVLCMIASPTPGYGEKRAIKEFGYASVSNAPRYNNALVMPPHERLVEFVPQIRSTDYENYILSDEWREKRKNRIKIDGGKCQSCGGPAQQVHHLTYARFKNEVMDDLISLCMNCHDRQHEPLINIKPDISGITSKFEKIQE